MKIVLNKANPSATLVIAGLNAAGQLLPDIDVQTQKPTISPGSVGVKFDSDAEIVGVEHGATNELQITLTKQITSGATINAVATALNENGDLIKSDPLEILIEADPADGIAATLVWQLIPAGETGSPAAAGQGATADIVH